MGFIKTGSDLSEENLLKEVGRTCTLSTRNQFARVFAAGEVGGGNIKRAASAVGQRSIAVSFVYRVLAE